jgi:hypothetical protein
VNHRFLTRVEASAARHPSSSAVVAGASIGRFLCCVAAVDLCIGAHMAGLGTQGHKITRLKDCGGSATTWSRHESGIPQPRERASPQVLA